MKKITLLSLAKKSSPFEDILSDYKKRFQTFSFQENVIKPKSDDIIEQGVLLLNKVQSLKSSKKPLVVLLSEHGSAQSTEKFSATIKESLSTSDDIFYLIGGAKGHSSELLKKVERRISLSPLTFPHQFARLLFIEQLYRAETLWLGHPYHH